MCKVLFDSYFKMVMSVYVHKSDLKYRFSFKKYEIHSYNHQVTATRIFYNYNFTRIKCSNKIIVYTCIKVTRVQVELKY